MRLVAVSFALISTAIFAVPASAHHSFAMFDIEKTMTLKGTVTEYEWTNPHSWLRMMIVDQKSGKPAKWAFEMSSPGRQTQLGMTKDSVHAGDQVTVTFHPMKDGSRGGQFIQAILANGKPIVRGERGQAPVD
jgi:hypothetical protein